MTIPSSTLVPSPNDAIRKGDGEATYTYLKELKDYLNDSYDDMAYGINGSFRSNYAAESRTWTPTLDGATTTGTFTYDHQIGWVHRKGIMVDCWFDIKWTAIGTAAGNLFLTLPYKAALTDQKPFVGVVQPSGITYTGGAGMVINAISNTFRGEFWNTGTGFTSANQAVVSTGQIAGHIRYIGQRNE